MEKFNTRDKMQTFTPGIGGSDANVTKQCGRIWSRIFVLVATVCLLASCSAIRIGYNNADTVVYWWLNSYVDFEAAQKPLVRQEIAALQAWHRKTQLKDYVQLLVRVQKQLQNGELTSSELIDDFEEIQKRAQIVLVKAAPALTDLAFSFRPEQLSNIQKKFNANNEEYQKKYLIGDLEKWQKLRFDKLLEQAEFWFGDFNREQTQKIRRASDARPMNNPVWMEERLARQQEMITLLQRIKSENMGRDAAIQLLQKHVIDMTERSDNPQRKLFFDNYAESLAQTVLSVINMATPAQKNHAINKIQSWIDDLNALAVEESR